MKKIYHAPQAYQPRRIKKFPPAKPGCKYCSDCEQEKTFDEFHKMNASSDGYRPICKACRKERDHQPKIIVQLPLFVLSKVCAKCGIEKDCDDFDKQRDGKYGYVSDCKKCRSEYNHQFWVENLEDCRARGRAKRLKPETNIQQMRRHRERSATDPHYLEQRRQRRQRYYQTHKEQSKDCCIRRRARKLNATIGEVDYSHILELYGYHCHICDKPIDPNAKMRSSESLSFDHVIPLHARTGEPQGAHSEENLRPSHVACNVRKGNRPLASLTPFDRRGPN